MDVVTSASYYQKEKITQRRLPRRLARWVPTGFSCSRWGRWGRWVEGRPASLAWLPAVVLAPEECSHASVLDLSPGEEVGWPSLSVPGRAPLALLMVELAGRSGSSRVAGAGGRLQNGPRVLECRSWKGLFSLPFSRSVTRTLRPQGSSVQPRQPSQPWVQWNCTCASHTELLVDSGAKILSFGQWLWSARGSGTGFRAHCRPHFCFSCSGRPEAEWRGISLWGAALEGVISWPTRSPAGRWMWVTRHLPQRQQREDIPQGPGPAACACWGLLCPERDLSCLLGAHSV